MPFTRSGAVRLLVLPSLLFADLPVWAQVRGRLSLLGGAQALWMPDPLGVGNGAMTGRTVRGSGYLLGAAIDLEGRSPWMLRVELQGSERRTVMQVNESSIIHAGTDIGPTIDDGLRTHRLHSVVLPVLLSTEPWPGFRLLVGPSVGYTLRVTEVFSGMQADAAGEMVEGTFTRDITGAISSWEWSFVAGMEVNGHGRMAAAVRYVKGLTDLDRAQGASPSLPEQLQVVLSFRLVGGPSRDAQPAASVR
jgi:hypothetical protein